MDILYNIDRWMDFGPPKLSIENLKLEFKEFNFLYEKRKGKVITDKDWSILGGVRGGGKGGIQKNVAHI